MQVNLPNQEAFDELLEAHEIAGCEISKAAALTDLIADCVSEKRYKVLRHGRLFNQPTDIKKFDVVMYTNMSNDVFFGVCMEVDSNVVYLYGGSPEGVTEKIIEG